MVLPRHVICVLGAWQNLDEVQALVDSVGSGFTLDRDYSQCVADTRMTAAFEASLEAYHPAFTDDDWESIAAHTAVVYLLSPPLQQDQSEALSGKALLLVAHLLAHGGLAAKCESAGLTHGRTGWLQLAQKYANAVQTGDAHAAGAALYYAWVQRLIHDASAHVFYSVGMHLLGLPDGEIDDAVEPREALEWVEMLGLYLAADKPARPLLDGAGFRLRKDGPRRIIQSTSCERYAADDFMYNPYGYIRL